MAPANLHSHIQKQLNQMVRHTLSNSEVKSRILAGGLDPAPGSSKDLSKLIAWEAAKCGRVVQQSGAKLD
jgi:tripartite-type tricarboxylate transporter receptor subunit TctC